MGLGSNKGFTKNKTHNIIELTDDDFRDEQMESGLAEISELIKARREAGQKERTRYVFLNDLAKEMRLDHSNFRKFILKHNVPMEKIQNPIQNNQKCLALTHEDAKRVIKLKMG